jgi:homoserine O-acetyltransferase
MQFPQFTITDMVKSQHLLITGQLKISELHAVIGISMGGMQAFQWIVSYPHFVNKAIPIHGTPKQTTYDLLLWTAEVRAIQSDPAWRGGEYTAQPLSAMKTVAAINSLALTTPEHRNRETTPEEFSQYLDETARRITHSFDANNWIRQAQAMMAHDISKEFGGSMEEAAAAVQASVFVVVGLRDHLVNSQPALDFARLVFAPTLELESECGHLAIGCQRETAFSPIRRFIEAG